jgi:hypothetical protein
VALLGLDHLRMVAAEEVVLVKLEVMELQQLQAKAVMELLQLFLARQ